MGCACFFSPSVVCCLEQPNAFFPVNAIVCGGPVFPLLLLFGWRTTPTHRTNRAAGSKHQPILNVWFSCLFSCTYVGPLGSVVSTMLAKFET